MGSGRAGSVLLFEKPDLSMPVSPLPVTLCDNSNKLLLELAFSEWKELDRLSELSVHLSFESPLSEFIQTWLNPFVNEPF
jgi:hypothetical protein